MPDNRTCYGNRHHLIPLFLAIIICTLLSACTSKENNAELAGNTLTIVTRMGYTTYFEGTAGPGGLEYELALRFAQSQGKELKVIQAFNPEELFTALANGDADIAAAGLTLTASREQRFLASAPYLEARQQVLYRYGGPHPRQLSELAGLSVLVTANSSHSENLARLQIDLPGLTWQESNEFDTVGLLEELNAGRVDAIVLDSNEFEVNKSLFVDIDVAFSISDSQPMVWYMRKDAPQELAVRVNNFLEDAATDGVLDEIQERLYGHSSFTKRISNRIFYQRLQDRLPDYEQLIKKVAREENIDWRLLAAVSYQESHWNPDAKSRTGVRGMMMLTHAAASEVGIDDRADTEQSLRGGARYFLQTRDRIPIDIREPDRTWLALAAYNVGLGHLEDARIITERQGGDPDRWLDVMQRLPLLAEKVHFDKTQHGFARGREPVAFVQHIRHFFNILAYNELIDNRRKPPLDVALYMPEQLRSPGRLVAL